MLARPAPSPLAVVVDERRHDGRGNERVGITAGRHGVSSDLLPPGHVLSVETQIGSHPSPSAPCGSQRRGRAPAYPERRSTRLRRQRLDRDVRQRT